MSKHEIALTDRSRQGDHDAFAQLVRMYQDRLFNSITHSVRCSAEAEDIVQETFVRAYLKLPEFRGESSFYTWLYRIARNFVSSRQRARQTISLETSLSAVGQEPADPRESATATLERAEASDRLHAALDRLSEEFRTILVLREIDGFDYATIAEMLELNVGTVRSRLHRARVELSRVCNSLKGVEQ